MNQENIIPTNIKNLSFIKTLPETDHSIPSNTPVYDLESLDSLLAQNNSRSLKTPRKILQSSIKTPKTPSSAKILPGTPNTPTLNSPQLQFQFKSRSNLPNSVIDVFNNHIPHIQPNAQSISQSQISLAPCQQTDAYRYMFDKIQDEGLSIDESIDAIAELIAAQEQCKLLNTEIKDDEEEEPTVDTLLENMNDPVQLIQKFILPPNIPRQEEILTVGRICCDTAEDSARINERSILLETSRLIGNGSRIRLNLDSFIEKGLSYSVFPGQIIGVRGTNPSGRVLNVTDLVYPPIPPFATSEVSKLIEIYKANDGGDLEMADKDGKLNIDSTPIQVIVASGPYTLLDSLEYELLEALLEAAAESPPHVLILLGPFIDATHPMIIDGMCTMTPENIFKAKIANRLKNFLNPKTKVILIPSTKDLISEWTILPQPPLGTEFKESDTRKHLEALGLDNNQIITLPNPVTFLLNECLISISNTDTLLDMARCETGRLADNGLDRSSIFFQHMLQQRHLHPVSPTENRIHYDRNLPFLLGIRPDIIIIPSALKHSVKSVEDVLCINPGKLCKGKVSGTYTRLSIYPLDIASMHQNGEEDVLNGISSRARVEVIKL